MSEVLVRTPAKINLALLVGPPRPDGFHELASVYQAVDRYDEVTATSISPEAGATDLVSHEAGPTAMPSADTADTADTASTEANRTDAAGPARFAVEVFGPGAPSVPSGSESNRNLAVRAAALLAEECGVTAGVRLTIRKGIPVAGGMAGGSSDAAAALVACDRAWDLGLSRTRLLELAARLGSDVPFCLLGETALGSGHGELVEPVQTRGRYCWALALASDGLSTPEVYARLDTRRAGSPVPHPEVGADLLVALADGDLRAVGNALTNDLQSVALALRPELRQILDEGLRLGALGALVSGSGPTCAFLAEDPEHTEAIASGLQAAGRCEQVATATGPAPGARVVERS